MNLVILGTGALARLCYARFQADHPVMIGRHFGSYTLVDHEGHPMVYHPDWIPWEETPQNRPEIVLVAVKWTAITAVHTWLTRWGGDALVVSLLNGMDQESALIPPLNPHQLSIATTTDAISRQDHAANQHWQAIVTNHGETYLTRTDHPHESTLITRAHSMNLLWHWEDPIAMQHRRWAKLIANSVINPLSALAARTNGETIQMPLWQLARPLTEEAEAVARREGVNLSQTLPHIEGLARATARNRSSMLQDVLENIPTEIDAITGYIIAKAAQHGLSVPTHQAIYTLVKQLGHRPTSHDTP